MRENALPRLDASDNPTVCCPRFNPEGWDNQELHFKDKPFVRATTKTAMHVPLDMGHVFTRVQTNIEDASAFDPEQTLVLSRDVSPWETEHYFAVTSEVDKEEMTALSGDFITRVFEGPYRKVKDWTHEMEIAAKAHGHGHEAKRVFMFYTTCPKCAKVYGNNYVVGVAEV